MAAIILPEEFGHCSLTGTRYSQERVCLAFYWGYQGDTFRMVGNPEVIHFVRSSGCPETRLLRSSRGPLAAILLLSPRRLQLPIPLGQSLLLMPAEHVPRRVHSVVTDERFLHFQLRQDKSPGSNYFLLFLTIAFPQLFELMAPVEFSHFLRIFSPVRRNFDV